jgi:hypothetical protein
MLRERCSRYEFSATTCRGPPSGIVAKDGNPASIRSHDGARPAYTII